MGSLPHYQIRKTDKMEEDQHDPLPLQIPPIVPPSTTSNGIKNDGGLCVSTTPRVQSSITRPVVQDNNLEIKPKFIQMVQNKERLCEAWER